MLRNIELDLQIETNANNAVLNFYDLFFIRYRVQKFASNQLYIAFVSLIANEL